MGHTIGKLTCIISKSPTRSVTRNSLYSVTAKKQATNQQVTSFQQERFLNSHYMKSNKPVTHTFYILANKLSSSTPKMSCHQKARIEIYPREKDIKRVPVPDNLVPWENEFLDYNPTEFTSKGVLSQPVWADLPDPVDITFDVIDEKRVDRRSYRLETITDGDGKSRKKVVTVKQVLDEKNFPRNPQGRTGLKGRGCLGRWGPNHAGDPIVTRWKRNDDNSIVKAADGKPILQFVSVQRRDNHEWALPGGMVDPEENRTATIIREFGEEALNSLEATDEQKLEINQVMKDFFVKGRNIYIGYVDDPRNTDNAWMETKAINFHDEAGCGVGAFKLNAGDDAMSVRWMDIDSSLKLYASHIDFIKKTVDIRNAHW